MNKCASMGHFDGHGDAPVRRSAPKKHAQGYLRRHWTLPLGDCLPCISLVDAMVTNFHVNKTVVALCNHFLKLA